MSARRQARSRAEVPSSDNDTLPRALAVGPCIEVWAWPSANALTARSRYASARQRWIKDTGMEAREARAIGLGSTGSPWSINTHADSHRRPARAGLSATDLPDVRAEANELFHAAVEDERSIARS